jgi:hypothetical protein
MKVYRTRQPRAPLLPIIVGLAASGLVVATPARAGTTLADLLSPGATIDSGGLQFSNFLLLAQSALNGAPLPDPTQITVTPESFATSFGLMYTFQPSPFTVSGTGAFANLAFQYDVSSLNGVSDLGSNFLSVNGTATGDSSVIITEGFLSQLQEPFVNEVLLDGTVFPNLPSSTLALPDLMPSWTATTNLTWQSNASNAPVTVTSYSTSFSAVPEPTSVLLMVLGLGATWCGRKLARHLRELRGSRLYLK